MIRIRFIKSIEKKAEKLAAVMRETFGETVCVNQVGSLMSLFFTDEKVVDYDTVQTSDTIAIRLILSDVERGHLFGTVSV